MNTANEFADSRVDAFVAAVNSSEKERLLAEEIPEGCRLGDPDQGGFCDWKIVPSLDASWLPDVERRLPFPIPNPLRSLDSRYRFPSFEAGPVIFYSVGVTSAQGQITEFGKRIFSDPVMCPFLLKNGFMHFAQSELGLYNPLCFDFRNDPLSPNPPVVRIDHEEVLVNDRLEIAETISPALDQLHGKIVSDFTQQR